MHSTRGDPRKSGRAQSLAQSYAGETAQELPIGGYAALLAAFLGASGALIGAASARGALPSRLAARDIVLLGVATHKLTRILTKDWITIPLRFPFAVYRGSASSGEVKESSRGRGLRRAVGDLLTCAFCTGPWVATALTAGLVTAPRQTRTIAGVLAMVTASDFLHHAYGKLRG